jgi:hypothetical protein
MAMNSLTLWLQNWSDACTYAGECAPDVAAFLPPAPYPALITIALACFAIWRLNERGIARLHAFERVTPLGAAPAAAEAAVAANDGAVTFALHRQAA